MTTIVSDIFWAAVLAGKEAAYAATGATKEEQAAGNAAVLAGAAASGATAVAASQAALIAVAAANAAMDEMGVPADSPMRDAVETTAGAAATVTSGGASVGSLVKSTIEVGAEVTAAALEEAGVDGAQHFAMLSSVASLDGARLDVGKTVAQGAGAAAGMGAAMGAQLGADPGADEQTLLRAGAIGASYGVQVGGAGQALATGSTGAALRGAVDLTARAGLAAGITARAEAQGEGDHLQSLELAGAVRVSALEGLAQGDASTALGAIQELGAASSRVVSHTELEAEARLYQRYYGDAASATGLESLETIDRATQSTGAAVGGAVEVLQIQAHAEEAAQARRLERRRAARLD